MTALEHSLDVRNALYAAARSELFCFSDELQERKDMIKTNFARLGIDGLAKVAIAGVSYDAVKINVDGMKILTSATKPFVIPLVVDEVAAASQDTGAAAAEPVTQRRLLYKVDDCRKDQVALRIIKFMTLVLRQRGLSLPIVSYNAVPFSCNDGFIEMVDKATTVHAILHSNDYRDVLQFMLKQNQHRVYHDTWKDFAHSYAGYTVMMFLIVGAIISSPLWLIFQGAGDRHMENQMIRNDGRLFHIDFGFLLGMDPKSFLASNVPLHACLSNALGGDVEKKVVSRLSIILAISRTLMLIIYWRSLGI